MRIFGGSGSAAKGEGNVAETNTQNPLGLRLSQLTDEELDYLL